MREPYLLDGNPVPSVTEILTMYGGGFENLMVWSNNLGKRQKDYREELEFLASVGTAFHRWVEEQWNGADESDTYVDPKVWKSGELARQAFKQWVTGKNVQIISQEKRMVSRAWECGGTYDLICTIDDGPVILVDFKTATAIRPKNIAQVAAYIQMVNETENREIDTACILRFGRNGTAGELWVDGPLLNRGLETFMLARQMWELDKELQLDVKYEHTIIAKEVNTPKVYCAGKLTVGTA